jgi:hypothetical protein
VSIPNRMTVKFFVQQAAALEPAAFIPLFHRWIRERTVEGLLIDVADYRHVQNGPAVILVGHEVDYVLDLDGGRPGLLTRQKRCAVGDLATRLHALLRLALRACDAISSEPSLGGRVRFDTGRLEVAFPDRLHIPNTPETVATIQPAVRAVLDELYGDTTVLKHVYKDGRRPLTLRVEAQTVDSQQLTVNSQQSTVNSQLLNF